MPLRDIPVSHHPGSPSGWLHPSYVAGKGEAPLILCHRPHPLVGRLETGGSPLPFKVSRPILVLPPLDGSMRHNMEVILTSKRLPTVTARGLSPTPTRLST